jgi:hypothetical protein
MSFTRRASRISANPEDFTLAALVPTAEAAAARKL